MFIHLKEVPSTQTLLKELALSGAPHGTLVSAERQTQGYGRFQRPWSSRRGGLWFSLLLRKEFQGAQEAQSRMLESVTQSVEKVAGVRLKTKPSQTSKSSRFGTYQATTLRFLGTPNDLGVFQKGAWRKVCGILTEFENRNGRIDWIVLGVGINVNNPIPASLKSQAVSLKQLGGQPVNLQKIWESILDDWNLHG